MSERVHDIDVTHLAAETIGKVNISWFLSALVFVFVVVAAVSLCVTCHVKSIVK